MKNCRELLTSLCGMTGELSEGDCSDDFYSTLLPCCELGWKTFHHNFLQVIFVFEFASNKQVISEHVQNSKTGEMFVVFVVKSKSSLSLSCVQERTLFSLQKQSWAPVSQMLFWRLLSVFINIGIFIFSSHKCHHTIHSVLNLAFLYIHNHRSHSIARGF